MSISLIAGKRALVAQAPRRRESTLVYKAEGYFCSSQVIITRAPNNSTSPRSEAKRLHQPKPLQAEPCTCQSPKPSALLSAPPSTSSSTSTLHSKSQNFTFCPFPPAPLSRAGLFPVGSSTPCPDVPPQPGPGEATSTTPADPTKAGICSPVVVAPLLHLSGHGYLARNSRNPHVHPHPPSPAWQHLPAAVLPHHCNLQ